MLIDTDVAHAFDCDGQLTAIGWIEGASRPCGQLRDRVLEGRPYAVLDEPLCGHLAAGLGPASGTPAGGPEAYKRWRDALGWLAVDVPVRRRRVRDARRPRGRLRPTART